MPDKGALNVDFISAIHQAIDWTPVVGNAAQKRAIEKYRARLTQRGFRRFEVLALESDREVIRALARQLSEDGPEAEWVRQTVKVLDSG